MFNKVRCDICNLETDQAAYNTFGDTIICADCQDDIRLAITQSVLFEGTFFYRFLASNYIWLSNEYNKTSQEDHDILLSKFCRFIKDNDFNF